MGVWEPTLTLILYFEDLRQKPPALDPKKLGQRILTLLTNPQTKIQKNVHVHVGFIYLGLGFVFRISLCI